MKTICEQDIWWFSIGANFSHLVWTPDPHICSGKPVSWRRPFWLYVVLFQVFLSALCRYLRILVSWAEFSIWKRSVPPWARLCFSSSYEMAISVKYPLPLLKIGLSFSGLFQLSVARWPLYYFFIFGLVWLNDQPVSRLTAGGLDDLPSVCPGEGPGSGELLDMLLLQMTLARDTERWAEEQRKSQW